MIRIDTHAHVFSKHDSFSAKARYTPSYSATINDFLSHLDAHNLSHGVLVQPSFLGTDNQILLNALKAHPNRLKGIAVVDKEIQLTNLLELRKLGVVGVRVNLFGLAIPNFLQNEWIKFLQHLEQLDFQLELHAPPAYLVQILPILNKYNLNIVIDHFGRISPEKGIEDPDYQTVLRLIDPKKHWIKVSGFYRLGNSPKNLIVAQKAFLILKEKGFLEKMVWGSDWPHTQHESIISYDSAVEAFKLIVEDHDEQSLILGKNAAKLFHIQ